MKILKTAKFNKLSSKIFIGDCVTGLNNEYFRERVANDATMLAQLVENGQEISLQDFFNTTGLLDSETIQKLTNGADNYSYFYNYDKDIAWFYDENKDIEYFYAKWR